MDLLAGVEGEKHWEHNCDLLDSCSSLPVGSTLPTEQAPGVGCRLPNVEQVDFRHLG